MYAHQEPVVQGYEMILFYFLSFFGFYVGVDALMAYNSQVGINVKK